MRRRLHHPVHYPLTDGPPGQGAAPDGINYNTPGYNTGAVRTDKAFREDGFLEAQLVDTAHEYRGCPFQCVNGGMYIYKKESSYSPNSPWEATGSADGRPAYRFGCDCLPPGRDLFEGDSAGGVAWFGTAINDTNEGDSGHYHLVPETRIRDDRWKQRLHDRQRLRLLARRGPPKGRHPDREIRPQDKDSRQMAPVPASCRCGGYAFSPRSSAVQ